MVDEYSEDYYKQGWKNKAQTLTKKQALEESQQETLEHMIDSPDRENFVLAKELLRLKISDVLVQGLNPDQTYTFLQILDYFQDPKDVWGVVIKGYAGTGKTYLIKRIIEYITMSHPKHKIAITAPTNKAVQILVRNSPFHDKTAVFEDYKQPKDKIVYCTIHKLLGLKEEITNSGEQHFVTSSQSTLSDYHYLIIDEVSMLPDHLFVELMKFDGKVKFIFMGDPAQIPPINKEQSLPLRVTPLTLTEKATHKIQELPKLLRLELNQIMRQTGQHPIIDLGMHIRNHLSDKDPVGNIATTLNAEKKGIVRINGKTERHLMFGIINRLFNAPEYKVNTDFVKMIAWRNKTVEYLNSVVRKTLFGDNLPTYVPGEKLVANSALFNRNRNDYNPQEYNYLVKANTSDEFEVISVSIVEKSFKERYRMSPVVNFTGKFYRLHAKGRWGDGFLFVIHEDSKKEYEELLDKLKRHARIMSIKELWVMYYNARKWSDDVSYNYAITAHKSQGSTYTHTILIEEDLDFNRKTVERNRIKYTAYTRATDRVYVLK